MKTSLTFGSLLLLSTALIAPSAIAQTTGAPAGTTADAPPSSTADAEPAQPTAEQADNPEEQVEISAPGAESNADIVVTGRFIPNVVRATPEVVSVLSAADIARTGEGDIAGALSRVTGLSVVGNGFVYVRGLGDRYSSALLNGSPLPSPEPLRRVVPLDIFPTSVIASSLVQKSYSVNYPGEFGGGVINLTTKAVPKESFLTIGFSGSGDSETTGKLGYTYYGSDTDWTGFDDGTRDMPNGLSQAVRGGSFGSTTDAQRRDFAAGLVNAPTSLLQRNFDIPMNFAADISAGGSTDVGATRIGFIAAVGYSNSWRTRSALQQFSNDPNVEGTPQESFNRVTTDNRIIVNGLLGLGAEFGDHQIRWTNLYIRDTLKQGRLAAGFNRNVADQEQGLPPSLIEQNSFWFERQLIDTQLVGEFKFDDLSVDVRGAYANSQRESPYERSFSYFYLGDGDPTTKGAGDVDDYVNNLSSAGQSASVAFSDLNEDVYSGAIDFGYKLPSSMPISLSAGYAYTKTERSASRYQFQYFRPDGALPLDVAQERPDYLISDYNIYNYNIQLRDVSGAEGTAAYDANLEVHAGYGQVEAELVDGLRIAAGVRYEDAKQTVQPVGASLAPTNLNNSYWLPAATLTWNFADDMQIRVHGSKTIARPQFRELAQQIYQDYESDREFTGNPFLVDSKLWNAEARYEWFFGRGQQLTLAGFYKKIENPIEAAAFIAGGGQFRSGFANAPEAQLYGGEIEVQKHVPLDTLGGDFFSTRRLVLIGNYTYTQSKLKVDDSMIVGPNLQAVAANLLFKDGAPLTGQSDHLANLQIGIEDTDKLSQATILLTYASKRVVDRGPIQGELRQPDIIEKPGFRLDFVAREGVTFLGTEVELKFEARNITGTRHQEYQQSGANRIDINTYDVGRSFSLGAQIKF